MTMIESMAASRIARVVSRLSANCASAAMLSVRSRTMKTAWVTGPSLTRSAWPRASTTIQWPSACWAR